MAALATATSARVDAGAFSSCAQALKTGMEHVTEPTNRPETYCKMCISLTRQGEPCMLLVTEIDADALRRHYNTLVNYVSLKDAIVEQVTFYLLP